MKFSFRTILGLLLLTCLSGEVFAREGIQKREKYPPDGERLKGRVVDAYTGESVPFARVEVSERELGTVCDVDGLFYLNLLPKVKEKVHLTVSSLGYAPKDTVVTWLSSELRIPLNATSISLEGFSVTAKYSPKKGSDAEINQETLEYIQPTSLRDIFLLLPGGIKTANHLGSFSYLTSRQAGYDASTSYGIGLSVDGIPISNDGKRVQMSGYTGSTEGLYGQMNVNSGIDLRSLSTDHIESVTVAKGIASAKEGNMSSGLLKVHSKSGRSPLRVRLKADPLNKLFYVGKGFLISPSWGTIHLGMDLTKSVADITDPRTAYNRFTAQSNYNNLYQCGSGSSVHFNLRGSYVRSFLNVKNDEITERQDEFYKTTFERLSLALLLGLEMPNRWLESLKLSASLDYSRDEVFHTKQVYNHSVLPLQFSTTEGENEGIYLPRDYKTSYRLDNRPLNLFIGLDGVSRYSLGRAWGGTIIWGNAFSYVKNWGKGAIVDTQRPPFPSTRFVRPRPNFDIPALVHNASYVELKLNWLKGSCAFFLQAGLRGTQMLNLPEKYVLSHKYLVEPRLQASYTKRFQFREKDGSLTLRAGWGEEKRLPSLDYLYPDAEYQDFIVLNAYFANQPEWRHLITNTVKHQRENPNIRENRNRKLELGTDWRYGKLTLSFSLFRERMTDGLEYFTLFKPVSYQYYYKLKHQVSRKPSKEDFYAEQINTFTQYSKPANSAFTVKQGLEYRMSIQNIKWLSSDIEINGAYYRTLYANGLPIMVHPSVIIDNKSFPYIGIFDDYDKVYMDRCNTNIWIHTRLPKQSLIFTNFLQLLWWSSSYRSKDISMTPERYMDTSGRVYPFVEAEVANNPILANLRRPYVEAHYNKEIKPYSLLLNTKVTKEFGKHIRLSFFADNILFLSPAYKNAYRRTVKERRVPFFGTELTLKF